MRTIEVQVREVKHADKSVEFISRNLYATCLKEFDQEIERLKKVFNGEQLKVVLTHPKWTHVVHY